MKKNYLIVMLALICNFAMAQIEPTTYRGAFAPNTAMWTDTWTNWTPNDTAYDDAATVVNVTTDITTNTTWTTGKTYKMNGLIYVKNNATLTIQPGVIVKGVYSSTGTALIITKGAKINAVGTATSPIVFTSAKAAGQRLAGDWGGIILLGKAGFNLNNGINNIEGITATVNTEYGGGTTPNDADNSGTLKYVRIEFGGYVFSPNNEINGLTFGAVGSGTTIDYVQVSLSGDDSFEWFGGAVNCKHLVAFKGLDDDFDTDNGYKGFVQFALGVRDPSIADNPTISTSEGFESDNNAGTSEAATGYDNTTAIFTNCTMVGPSKRSATVASGYARALRLRRSTELKIYNSIFLDFKNNYAGLTDDQTIAKYYVGKLKLKNNIFAGIVAADLTAYPKGINPVTKTGNSTTNALGLPTNTNFDLSAKMVAEGNTTIASSDNVLVQSYNTTLSDYSGLDYRPGTVASTGADFTDASMAPYIVNPSLGDVPVVAAINYCKGAVASPLTAALTATGVSLKWYTVSTGGTAATTAPTPATATLGEKTYYVSQMSTLGFESDKVALKVTVNALPTEVVGTITGTGPVGSTSAVAVGKYVGTNAAFTYSVPAFADASLSYLWTVPNGATITNGQGTATITVNYLLEPAGAGAVGTISVQAVNASKCATAAKTLAITKALPAAPATIKLTLGSSATAITSYAKYMGTTTPLTLNSGTVVDAAEYQWELPTGVNVAIPAATVPATTTKTYSAEPFLSVNSAPSTVGTKYWTVTENTYTYDVNGVATTTKISTAAQKIVGSTKTYTFTIAANAANANAVNTLFTYNGNTYKLTAATTASSTTAVCTYSSAFPGTFPTALSTTVNGTLTPVSAGNSITFSKIAVAGYDVTTSQAYAPYGTRVRTNLPSILVNFAGVTNPLTTKLYLGAKSANGVGTSVSTNATNADVVANRAIPGLTYTTYAETFVAPNANTLANATSVYNATGTTPSTAKLLPLTAAAPAAPAAIKMTNDAVSTTVAVTSVSTFVNNGTVLTLTATPSVLASSYSWELPEGVIRVSADESANTNVIQVVFAGGPAGTTSYYIGVIARNGIGMSRTANVAPSPNSPAKFLKLTAAIPAAAGAVTGSVAICATKASSVTYTITAVAKDAIFYNITAPAGCTFDFAYGTTAIIPARADAKFTVNYPAGFTANTTTSIKTITIQSVNGVGVNTTATNKVLKLTNTGAVCPADPFRIASTEAVATVSATEVYPNPVSDDFNIDVTAATAGVLEIAIYSLDGTMIVNPKTVKLQEGANTINENVSSLNKGIYIVQLVNSSNGVVITKKLVKN